jgi:hypothetical protein
MDTPDTPEEVQTEPTETSLKSKLTFASVGGGLTAGALGVVGGNALVDLAIGSMVAYLAWSFSPELQAKTEKWFPKAKQINVPLANRVDWKGVFGLKEENSGEPQSQTQSSGETQKDQEGTPRSEEDALFLLPQAGDTGGIKRLTIEQIVAHTEPNSYRIFLGRSLTAAGNLAVQINIYKQHFRIIGSSQRGKSSWVAAFLDIVTRTHDKQHVLLALLDKEDQTSKLFAHLPHIARLKVGKDLIKLHGRSDAQVLEYLTYLMVIMNERYKLSKLEVVKLPIILIYVEEFLSLKNHFKAEMKKARATKYEDAKEEEAAKAKAIADYETLIYCITELAARGLKVRMQLLLCAQVDYVDNDFREAQANISCGISLCVSPKAAEAAGFKNPDLLYRNYKDNQVGQGVVEVPGCNDLVLAPDYPLEERLIAFEKAELEKEEGYLSDAQAGLKQGTTGTPYLRIVGPNHGDARAVRGDLDPVRFDEGLQAAPSRDEARSEIGDFGAIPEVPGADPHPSKKGGPPLVETVPTGPGQSPKVQFVAGPDDRVFTAEQEAEFLRRHGKQQLPVKEILRQMNNGEGLSNRYAKYANWLIEKRGLRK